jgi:hypothetical protein
MADKWSALGTKLEGIYVKERTFKVSSISRDGLDHYELLNQRGLKSTVEWEGQLSVQPTIQTCGSPSIVGERIGDSAPSDRGENISEPPALSAN